MNTVFVQRPILEFPDVPCGKIAEQPVGLIAFGENTLPGNKLNNPSLNFVNIKLNLRTVALARSHLQLHRCSDEIHVWGKPDQQKARADSSSLCH